MRQSPLWEAKAAQPPFPLFLEVISDCGLQRVGFPGLEGEKEKLSLTGTQDLGCPGFRGSVRFLPRERSGDVNPA